jgi:hypothetical protein
MEPSAGRQRRTGVRPVCIFLVAAILAGSCAAEDAEPSTTPDVLRGDLQTARQRWEEADIATYQYTFENDCGECNPSARSPREVVVWAGAHFDPGDVAPSVEEIFVEIEQALDTDRSVAVTFDPDLGYPTDVGFDSESRPVDGGRHWVVRDLKPGLPGSPVSAHVVARAEQTWLAARPDAYEYTLTVFCDCPLAGSVQTRVEGTTVVGHQVLYDETTGGTVTPMSIDAMFSDLAELMASIDGVVEDGVRFEGSARFDPELGYPIWVGLDVTVLAPDVELAPFPSQLVVTITDLHAVDVVPAPEAVDQLVELGEARARWSDSELTAYRYELALHMMMSAEFAGPFAVTVVDGAVTEITRDGEPVPEAQVTAYTVDDLFRLVDTALSNGVDSSVTYDERWGHLAFVALDLDAIAVDGGLVLSVSKLAPIDE